GAVAHSYPLCSAPLRRAPLGGAPRALVDPQGVAQHLPVVVWWSPPLGYYLRSGFFWVGAGGGAQKDAPCASPILPAKPANCPYPTPAGKSRRPIPRLSLPASDGIPRTGL